MKLYRKNIDKYTRIEFQFEEYENGSDITTRVYQLENGKFVDTGSNIPQNSISIEMENAHSLMRGRPQRTFNVGKLNSSQKKDIMESLDKRKLTIAGCFCPTLGIDSQAIIIHALT